jgi:prophage maintenance system killer protein
MRRPRSSAASSSIPRSRPRSPSSATAWRAITLPDGNKRTAFLAMVEFAERNGLTWRPGDEDDVVETMLAVAAGSLTEPDFVDWVARQLER